MATKKLLTRKILFSKGEQVFTIIASIIAFLLGVAAVIATLFFFPDIETEGKVLIQLGFAVAFAVTFCYAFGVRPIQKAIKQMKLLDNGEYILVKDYVIEKYNEKFADGETYPRIIFEKAKRESSPYYVDTITYRNTEIGDEFYILYEKNDRKKGIRCYSSKEWELSDEVRILLKI